MKPRVIASSPDDPLAVAPSHDHPVYTNLLNIERSQKKKPQKLATKFVHGYHDTFASLYEQYCT